MYLFQNVSGCSLLSIQRCRPQQQKVCIQLKKGLKSSGHPGASCAVGSYHFVSSMHFGRVCLRADWSGAGTVEMWQLLCQRFVVQFAPQKNSQSVFTGQILACPRGKNNEQITAQLSFFRSTSGFGVSEGEGVCLGPTGIH